MMWCSDTVLVGGIEALKTATDMKLVKTFDIDENGAPVFGDVLATKTAGAYTEGMTAPDYGYASPYIKWDAGESTALMTTGTTEPVSGCAFVMYAGSTVLFVWDCYDLQIDTVGEVVFFTSPVYVMEKVIWSSDAVSKGGIDYLNINAVKAILYSDFDVSNAGVITLGTKLAEKELGVGVLGYSAPNNQGITARFIRWPSGTALADAIGGGTSNHVVVFNAAGDPLFAAKSYNLTVGAIGEPVYFVNLKYITERPN